MFNVQTTNRMQYNSEDLWTGYTEFYYQTRSQSRNEINTHTEHLVQKHNDLLKNWKKAIWSLTKKKTREPERKESLHLTVKIARRSNYNIDLRKLRVNKITKPQIGSKWKTYRLPAMILSSSI